jgi:hypothetical protein
MRKLPTLEQLRVASPCTVPWDTMVGDDRVRRCDTCRQKVYNISEMTRAQAEEVIEANEARMCMRYYHRADGTILLRDCAVEYRPTGLLVAAGAAALALAGAAMWVDQTPTIERVQPPPHSINERVPTASPPRPPNRIDVTPPKERIYVTAGTPPPPTPPERKASRR